MSYLRFAGFACQPMQRFFFGGGVTSISWALTAAEGTVKKSQKRVFANFGKWSLEKLFVHLESKN
jgi:hypothetical protein